MIKTFGFLSMLDDPVVSRRSQQQHCANRHERKAGEMGHLSQSARLPNCCCSVIAN